MENAAPGKTDVDTKCRRQLVQKRTVLTPSETNGYKPKASRLFLVRRTNQQHRFVWAAPDAPSPGPPRAGRPITIHARKISLAPSPRRTMTERPAPGRELGTAWQAQPCQRTALKTSGSEWSGRHLNAASQRRPEHIGGGALGRFSVLKTCRDGLSCTQLSAKYMQSALSWEFLQHLWQPYWLLFRLPVF